MNSLTTLFKKKNIFIPYFTFGDRTIALSEDIIKESAKAGADIIEIGIPFSDPIADGPVIQASHRRALTNGEDVSLAAAFNSIQKLKKNITQPILFMLSVNLIWMYGIEQFFKTAKESRVAGVVIPDLPIEEATDYQKYAKLYNINIVFLISPLTKGERLKKIVTEANGFIYLISSKGITGERKEFDENLNTIIQDIKKIKDIPVAIGFGIKTNEQLKKVYNIADGAIMGSHLVKIINHQDSNTTIVKNMGNAIKEFKTTR